MKKAVLFSLIFLVHAYALLPFNAGSLINTGASFLTGGPSAGVSSLLGGGETGYDMSGFDQNAGAASGEAAFNPTGFTAMSDEEVAQMRNIANSMPVEAPVTGPTTPATYNTLPYDAGQSYYDPSQIGYVDPAIAAPGYGTAPTTYSGTSDFSGAAPVDYSQQSGATSGPGTYPTQTPGMIQPQQFDAMGNPILTTRSTVAATTPTTTVVIQQGPATTPIPPGASSGNSGGGSSSSGTQSAFGALGDSGGGMLVGAAGLTAVGGTTAAFSRRRSSNPKDQLVLSSEQARSIPERMHVVDAAVADYGDIVKTFDKHGNTKISIRTISKAKRMAMQALGLWDAKKDKAYEDRRRIAKIELKELQKRMSGIKSLSNPYRELHEAEMAANPLYRSPQPVPPRRPSFTPTPIKRAYPATPPRPPVRQGAYPPASHRSYPVREY